jgi:hypothetical protein
MDLSQLRPLGIGEVIDAGIHITRSRFRDLAILVAIVAVPAQILQFLVAISTPGAGFSFDLTVGPDASPVETGDVLTQLAATLLAFVIGLLTTWLATAACTEVISSTYLGGRAGWKESLAKAWSRFVSLIGANLLILLIAGAGFLAFVIPGIWLFVAYTVAVPAIIVEGIRGPAALGRSFRLVRHRWWPVFAIVLVGQLLIAVVQFFVTLPVLPVLLLTRDSVVAGLLATAVSTVVATVLTQPFVAALVVVIYYDLRVRKEGFDLALMAQRLDEEPASSPAPDPSTRLPDGPDAPPPVMPGPPGWAPAPPPGWEPRE